MGKQKSNRPVFARPAATCAHGLKHDCPSRSEYVSTSMPLLLLLMAINLLLPEPSHAADAIPTTLITFDPGHFHAALFQKEMLPDVSERAHVYAPLGPDLLAHLKRVADFNRRTDNPTHWQMEVHTGPDCLERALAEKAGSLVVISGNNRGKIDRIGAFVQAKHHVLADKPWIIEPADMPKLESALNAADQNSVAAFDAMTQRFEITCILARELVADPEIFGGCAEGSASEPAVTMESVHYLLKEVAGAPLLRPAWFFDIRQQGEGLADVGTHLVDLVSWTLFPDQAIDFRREIQVMDGARWPTAISRDQFQRVTGESDFPDFLRAEVNEGQLAYYANNRVSYKIRGIDTRLDIKWDFAAPPGGKDTETALFRGAKATVEVRQQIEESFRPEVYVTPVNPDRKAALSAALSRKISVLRQIYPGLEIDEQARRFHVIIPNQYRIGHEAHFALLTRKFLEYVKNPKTIPAWEKPNMLAKYYVTTKGIDLARRVPAKPNLETTNKP